MRFDQGAITSCTVVVNCVGKTMIKFFSTEISASSGERSSFSFDLPKRENIAVVEPVSLVTVITGHYRLARP